MHRGEFSSLTSDSAARNRADGGRVVAPGGRGGQRQAASSLEFWQRSLCSQAGGGALFLSACEPGTALRGRHGGLISGKGGQPRGGGTEHRETQGQRAGLWGPCQPRLGVSCWHVSRGSGQGKLGCQTPLCRPCTWLHPFLQKFLTEHRRQRQKRKRTGVDLETQAGFRCREATVCSDHCWRHLQEFCDSTQPILCQPSGPPQPIPSADVFPQSHSPET